MRIAVVRNHLICYMPAVSLLSTLLVGAAACNGAAPEPIILPPVGMRITGPYIAERSGALAFWGNGSLQSEVELNGGRVIITVRARGTTVDGQAPELRLALDGRDVGKIAVSSRTLQDYSVDASVPRSGSTRISVSFENFLFQPQVLRSRHVFIEQLSLRQPG